MLSKPHQIGRVEQSLIDHVHDSPPQPPAMPDLDACCGQGCNPCVFDVYDAARERYLEAVRAWQATHPANAPPT